MDENPALIPRLAEPKEIVLYLVDDEKERLLKPVASVTVPAGKNSLKAQIRNRKTNGLTSSGAVVKRYNQVFIVISK